MLRVQLLGVILLTNVISLNFTLPFILLYSYCHYYTFFTVPAEG